MGTDWQLAAELAAMPEGSAGARDQPSRQIDKALLGPPWLPPKRYRGLTTSLLSREGLTSQRNT